MKPLKVKAIVIEDFNDSKNDGKLEEEGKVLDLDYGRYEELKAKGKVEEYKDPLKPIKKEKNEDSNSFEVE